jgi:hypothetical protein
MFQRARNPKRTALVVVPVAGAIALASLASPATAGHAVPSRVTLKVAGGPPFHGRVTADDPACVTNRKVLLLEVAPEPGPIDLADNRTNGKGKWVFSSQLQGATEVRAKVTQAKAGGVRCQSALSRAKQL